MKIQNAKRFAIVSFVALATMSALMSHALKDDYKVVGTEEVVVEKGDTIWSLIHEHNDATVLNTGDIRESIDHFDAVNGYHFKTLREGDVVEVPLLAIND